MIKHLVFIGIGGALGSILRYLVSVYTIKYYIGTFPLATFIVNIVGCILIGLFIGLAERFDLINMNMRLFLITGFCGGFTTFSTFSSENFELIHSQNQFTMFSYILLSLIIGIAGVWIGGLIARI